MKNEMQEFLSERREVPEQLAKSTRALLEISINPTPTVVKFYLFQLLGMVCTLLVCPQFGFKAFGFSAVSHWIMALGTIPCAIICSSIFFSGGLFFTNIFLNKSQLKWLFERPVGLLLPFNGILYFIMMGSKQFSSVDYMHQQHGGTFDVTWILTSVVVAFCFTQLKRQKVWI